jgi:hypothetical protein
MNGRVDTGPVTPDVFLIKLYHANYIKNIQLKTKKLDMVEHL